MNMREIMEKVLTVNVDRRLKVEIDDYTKIPRTEITSHDTIGDNFQNIPRSANYGRAVGNIKETIHFIGVDGEIIATVPPSKHDKYNSPELYQKDFKSLVFGKSVLGKVAVCVIFERIDFKRTTSRLILLSEPMTMSTIMNKRIEHSGKTNQKSINNSLDKLSTYWK